MTGDESWPDVFIHLYTAINDFKALKWGELNKLTVKEENVE